MVLKWVLFTWVVAANALSVLIVVVVIFSILKSAYYGPQNKTKNLLMATLQFGGPSGLGYYSIRQRKQAFEDWQVDADMMSLAKPDALFMHCLPAHRGEEVSAEVIDGPQSVVWDEAENRMHVQKALMEYLLLGRQ